MTQVNIDEMPVGKETDTLVAEALGWHQDGNDWCNDAGEWQGYVTAAGGREYQRAWSPSTDLAATWQVEAQMPHFVLRRLNPTLWQCQSRICNEEYMSQPVWKRATAVVPPSVSAHDGMSVCDCCFAEGDTPMLAICRALLKLWASEGNERSNVR